MAQVRAIVLRAAGINCDMETEYALEQAGAQAECVHINRIIEDKELLEQFQIIVLPGGFSYGDDVAAGKILANQIIHHLSGPLQKFIDDGKLVLGICNGFQVLVKTGILPGNGSAKQEAVTITYNDSGKFEDRWVYLAPQTEKCIFIEPGRQIYLPIAHGEGKVVTKDEAALGNLKSEGHIAFKYVNESGEEGDYPINPNGSMGSIAGLTDSTGRVLGLMPHPERHVRPTQHPHWSRLRNKTDADGTTIFNNAVRYIKENFWPNKNSRERFEIDEFISAYKKLTHGCSLVVESKGENPDYLLKDTASGNIMGVELTSVYLDDRSVPNVHMKPVEGEEEIPYDSGAIEKYKKQLIQAIKEKVRKARNNYDTTHPLVLAVYVNEYISIHMQEDDWQAFVKQYEEVFDAISPFSEVVFYSLPDDEVFSVRPS